MASSVTIGSLTFPTNVFLAPMAGCTDLALRLISRENGARFCFFEMVDSNSIVYGNRRKTLTMLKTTREDSPIAVQLLGSDPSVMLDAAGTLLDILDVPFLDINAACPAKKAIKKRSGAFLLGEPEVLCNIIRVLVRSLPVPVTVKLRAGYNRIDAKHIASLARRCEDSGASCVFVHGRTALQGYSGEVDYGSIRAIKESLGIPVFGSGNVMNHHLAEKMFAETRCDGILVARGALGNPWIFDRIDSYLKSGLEPPRIDFALKKETLKKHLSYLKKFKELGPANNMGFMKKITSWYLKGSTGACGLRREICLVNSYEKMIEFIDKLDEGGRMR